jgi:hypothetical protein
MGEIIDLEEKLRKAADDLICREPWEFRRADWETSHFVQMLRSQSEKLQQHREEILGRGGRGVWKLPSHFELKGGMAFTIRSLLASRDNEERMREIYYLTGLMDCMINQVNPILRTDVLRGMYKRVFKMKEELKVNWYAPLDQILLPIDSHLYNEFEYRSRLRKAPSMEALYRTIRGGTDEMFDILSLEYVFYCPGIGG